MQQLGWVTTAEAAARARRSVRTIFRWMHDGTVKEPATLEARQIGKTWYISTRSLQKLLGPLADIQPGSRP